jgi:hypothetical protein
VLKSKTKSEATICLDGFGTQSGLMRNREFHYSYELVLRNHLTALMKQLQTVPKIIIKSPPKSWPQSCDEEQ